MSKQRDEFFRPGDTKEEREVQDEIRDPREETGVELAKRAKKTALKKGLEKAIRKNPNSDIKEIEEQINKKYDGLIEKFTALQATRASEEDIELRAAEDTVIEMLSLIPSSRLQKESIESITNEIIEQVLRRYTHNPMQQTRLREKLLEVCAHASKNPIEGKEKTEKTLFEEKLHSVISIRGQQSRISALTIFQQKDEIWEELKADVESSGRDYQWFEDRWNESIPFMKRYMQNAVIDSMQNMHVKNALTEAFTHDNDIYAFLHALSSQARAIEYSIRDSDEYVLEAFRFLLERLPYWQSSILRRKLAGLEKVNRSLSSDVDIKEKQLKEDVEREAFLLLEDIDRVAKEIPEMRKRLIDFLCEISDFETSRTTHGKWATVHRVATGRHIKPIILQKIEELKRYREDYRAL